MSKTVLIIGTLDTKGDEFAFVCDQIRTRGHQTLLMHTGTFEPTVVPDISADAVARAAGSDLNRLQADKDRGTAVSTMTRGATALTAELHAAGKIDAVISLGGSGGTAIATAAMRQLPVGVPKLMVSTVASGDVAPYVDIKDICMMYSVVDIAGLNPISRQILTNAVGMICGAVEQPSAPADNKPLIAATMFGVTTPCVTKVQALLDKSGYETVVFHATGSGGRAMEALIADGYIQAVADITTTEWCDELVGGVLSAGPDRLEAAGRRGIPQVVSVGALDMVNFWGIATVPDQFSDRRFYKHNDNVTLMRTTPEESAQLGRIIASKLNQATGPTALVLPLRGVSAIDAEGQPFYWPEADEQLFEALRISIAPHVELIELDAHINDDIFAAALADKLLSLIKQQTQVN